MVATLGSHRALHHPASTGTGDFLPTGGRARPFERSRRHTETHVATRKTIERRDSLHPSSKGGDRRRAGRNYLGKQAIRSDEMNDQERVSVRRDLRRHRSEPGIGSVDALKFVLEGSRFARPGTDPIPLRSVAKNFVLGALYLKTFRSWLGDRNNAALKEALYLRPSLVRSVGRPYLNAGWRATRKLEVIREHYELLRGRLDFLRFPPSCSIPLGTVAECVEVRLEKTGWSEYKGELTISLFSNSTRLYSLVFTLSRSGTGVVAYVGALQGLGRSDALEIYRRLTRLMHGLRPRDLLVAAFRLLCVSIEVKQILAISDGACVARSKYFGADVRLLSSYDSAWRENGGIPTADGFFDLDPHRVHRAMNDIPSRKRAPHRRRYSMLDDLALQISNAVEQAPIGRAEESEKLYGIQESRGLADGPDRQLSDEVPTWAPARAASMSRY